MQRITTILLLLVLFASCGEDNDLSQVQITFNFSHNWDGIPVSNTNFNSINYTNANGDDLSITKLRYLISKITFQKTTGETFILDGYNLVDVTNNKNQSFTSVTTIPIGDYSNVSFIFGFDNDDNYNGNYTDLNSASWAVPSMLGGGYHIMQLEGKFIDDTTTETGFAYHAIRAIDNSGTIQVFQDTFFKVNFGEASIENNSAFNIEMNIAEWFKNPNTWDLNILNNSLMSNFDAQVLMFENGQNALSLESFTP